MNKNASTSILSVIACAFVCYGQTNNIEKTNVAVSCQNTNCTETNAMTISLKEREVIEEYIARVPETILSETENVGAYIDAICGRISKVQDAPTRYHYYRAFMDKACTVRFEKIGESVPLERSDLGSDFYRYDRNREVARLEAFARGYLSRVAEQIWSYLWTEPIPAPGVEQFEPYFKLITKLQSEERRLGRWRISIVETKVDELESLILFTYLHDSRKTPDPQDRAAVEARFKQVVGRPIRSAEQYKADARRRTEANIREHRKLEEENRKAQEFQKKFNKEHNIDVK